MRRWLLIGMPVVIVLVLLLVVSQIYTPTVRAQNCRNLAQEALAELNTDLPGLRAELARLAAPPVPIRETARFVTETADVAINTSSRIRNRGAELASYGQAASRVPGGPLTGDSADRCVGRLIRSSAVFQEIANQATAAGTTVRHYASVARSLADLLATDALALFGNVSAGPQRDEFILRANASARIVRDARDRLGTVIPPIPYEAEQDLWLAELDEITDVLLRASDDARSDPARADQSAREAAARVSRFQFVVLSTMQQTWEQQGLALEPRVLQVRAEWEAVNAR